MYLRLLILNVLLIGSALGLIPSAINAQSTPAEWLAEIDRNLSPPQYEAYRKLINIEPDGNKKEFVMFTLKQGKDKVVALFLAPASDKGRSTLRIGDNMWLYIPNIGRPMRITSLQSVTGGVFNNADILQIDYQSEYEAVDLTETAAKIPTGKKLLLLIAKAKSGSVAYDRLEMLIDPDLKTPTEIKAFAASGILIKTLYFKNPTDFGNGIKRPSVVETDSPLYQGYKSVMIFAAIKPRKLPSEVFTTDFMGKLETLR